MIFIHNFAFMTKKVKILSAFLTLYLGILPVIFYAHASEHNEHKNNDPCHAQHLLVQDEDGSHCELCQLYFNQALYHSSISLIGEIFRPLKAQIEYHFFSVLLTQTLPFLRAPPILK